MNKKILIQPIFIVIVILILSLSMGCYTTFNHPKLDSYADSTGTYHYEGITFLDDCSSCHEQNTQINDAHLQVYDYPVYEENYNWQYYFVIPWWYDQYYYEDERQADANDRLPAPQRRDFDRREIPPSPATALPGASGSSLAKPSTSESTPAESPQPEPKKRHERRQVTTGESSKSEKATTASPTRKEREKKETKKEKK